MGTTRWANVDEEEDPVQLAAMRALAQRTEELNGPPKGYVPPTNISDPMAEGHGGGSFMDRLTKGDQALVAGDRRSRDANALRDAELAASGVPTLEEELAKGPAGSGKSLEEFVGLPPGGGAPGIMGQAAQMFGKMALADPGMGGSTRPAPYKLPPAPAPVAPASDPDAGLDLAPLVSEGAPAAAPMQPKREPATVQPSIQEAIAAIRGGLGTEAAPQPAPAAPNVVEMAKKMLMGSAPPKASGIPPDALEHALRITGQNRFVDGLVQAGAMAIGRGNDKAYDESNRNSSAPMQAYRDRQEGEQRRMGLDAAKSAADPNAPENVAARSIFEQISKRAGSPVDPQMLAGMTAAKLKAIMPGVEQLLAIESKKLERETAKINSEAAREDQQSFTAGQNSLQRAQSRENATIMAGERGEKNLDRQIETLSKRTEGSAAMKRDLDMLDKHANGGGDIPGVGATGFLPDVLISGEGTDVRQAARGVLSTIIRMKSGTAASEREVDRLMGEMGMGPTASDAQFRAGIKRLRAQAADELKLKEAGARPEAVTEARERGLTTSQDMSSGGASRPSRTDPSTGETRYWDGRSWVKG